jgi:hypothetical protein
MLSLSSALLALTLAQAQPGASPPAVPPPVVPVPPLQPSEAAPPPLPSLLSAEPLRGASLFSAALGWPRLRLGYAQGIGAATDLGGFADFDYTTTELRAGLAYRGRVIPRAPPFDGALRLWAAWYHDGGAQWVYRHNHPDEGIELGAGLSYSRRGAGGVVSLLADLPVTITFRKTGGVFVSPRAAVAYEAPLYGRLTYGLQLGMGIRGGLGNAPLRRGIGEVTLLGLVGYRL